MSACFVREQKGQAGCIQDVGEVAESFLCLQRGAEGRGKYRQAVGLHLMGEPASHSFTDCRMSSAHPGTCVLSDWAPGQLSAFDGHGTCFTGAKGSGEMGSVWCPSHGAAGHLFGGITVVCVWGG